MVHVMRRIGTTTIAGIAAVDPSSTTKHAALGKEAAMFDLTRALSLTARLNPEEAMF